MTAANVAAPAHTAVAAIVVLMFVIAENSARDRRPPAHDLDRDRDRTATTAVAAMALALALVEGWPYAQCST